MSHRSFLCFLLFLPVYNQIPTYLLTQKDSIFRDCTYLEGHRIVPQQVEVLSRMWLLGWRMVREKDGTYTKDYSFHFLFICIRINKVCLLLRGKVRVKEDKDEGRSTEVLSVFGVTDRSVRSRIPRSIYLHHPVRMTDGGFRDTYTIRTDGYFFLFFLVQNPSVTSVIRPRRGPLWVVQQIVVVYYNGERETYI